MLKPDLSAVRGKRVLIGLSGGADSVALACLLREARDAERLALFAAHVDHAIRTESADDAAWCRALCVRLDIPFHCVRIDVPAEAARTGEGLETVARRLRHDWLRQMKAELNADCIALAHHMDDQAETILMHLARGAGPEGIGGMRPMSGDLFRPLLDFRKRELIAYLEEKGVSWREDATNAVADTPRNALRLHGIPELEKSYPQIVPAVARYAESARIESDYLAELTDAYMASHLQTGPYGQFLRIDAATPRALLRRAIRRVCGGDTRWEKLGEIEALAAAERGRVEINGTLTAERGHSGIYFLPKAQQAIQPAPLALAGESALEGICRISCAPGPATPIRNDPLRQALNRDALAGAVLRTRRPGDVIRPLGAGEKTLKEYFIDKKLDRPLRDCVALVAKGNRVLWVCGLGVAEEAKLRGDADDAVVLACRYAYDYTIGLHK